MTRSTLRLVPHHRPGAKFPGGGYATERWTWDFEIDGVTLSTRVPGDVVGALGAGDPAWEASIVAKLRGEAAPDIPPDRVLLYVCPECGDLGCGAITAAIERTADTVVWRDLRYENDYDEAMTDPLAMGPFTFDATAYDRLLERAIELRADARATPLAPG